MIQNSGKWNLNPGDQIPTGVTVTNHGTEHQWSMGEKIHVCLAEGGEAWKEMDLWTLSEQWLITLMPTDVLYFST